jgi:hypothetical protein
MTCIVGLVAGDRVYIGGDSAAVGAYDLTLRADEKVFARGPFLVGFTTSFRMGQLLRYKLEVPQYDGRDLQEFMATAFVDAARKCLREGGWATKKDEQETGGQFLVGYRGHLFTIGWDFQVGEALDGMDAVGSGEAVAIGALWATPGRPPLKRVLTALEAAERHNAGVRAPFVVMRLSARGSATRAFPKRESAP